MMQLFYARFFPGSSISSFVTKWSEPGGARAVFPSVVLKKVLSRASKV